MYIKTKDQREFDKDYNSFWGDESNWKVPFRCKICPDAIGESSDIAALDTWRGGSPKGEDEGFNAAVMRTKKGIKVFNEAVESGYLSKEINLLLKILKIFSLTKLVKKSCLCKTSWYDKSIIYLLLKLRNLRIKELYNLNDDEFNKQQEEGTSKRVGN